jgi:hypothetical protein
VTNLHYLRGSAGGISWTRTLVVGVINEDAKVRSLAFSTLVRSFPCDIGRPREKAHGKVTAAVTLPPPSCSLTSQWRLSLCSLPCTRRYFCDYCDTFLTHDSVSTSLLLAISLLLSP